MTFSAAVRSCLSKYATFSGRARPAEYWWFALFVVLMAGLAALVGSYLHMHSLNWLSCLVLALPLYAAASRRLHDSGKTGWWNLLALLPPVGTVALLVLLMSPSEEGDNRYGSPTRPPTALDLEAVAFHRR
ncbi:MAG TPA: DUF805 domain-containing protein [Mycobacteriales bacterium]|nr:DUF805 domain-containing protein [Mycobacteriales bacterium]